MRLPDSAPPRIVRRHTTSDTKEQRHDARRPALRLDDGGRRRRRRVGRRALSADDRRCGTGRRTRLRRRLGRRAPFFRLLPDAQPASAAVAYRRALPRLRARHRGAGDTLAPAAPHGRGDRHAQPADRCTAAYRPWPRQRAAGIRSVRCRHGRGERSLRGMPRDRAAGTAGQAVHLSRQVSTGASRSQAAPHAAARSADVPGRHRPAEQRGQVRPARSAADADRPLAAGRAARHPRGLG